MYQTQIHIGKRVEKTLNNKHGWKRVDFIDDNETCVLILGGNGADKDSAANGYAKYVDDLLREYGIDKKKVGIYYVVYDDDGGYEDFFAPALVQKKSREAFLLKYGHNKTVAPCTKELRYIESIKEMYGADVLSNKNPEICDPEYIKKLFEKTLIYRISKQGKRLNFDEACRRVRNLNVVAHCHGAYVFLKMEELMQQKMKELGYSKQESEAIQKQLLCVSYSPHAPLGVSKSTMISFGSARDNEVWHQNVFHRELKKLDRLSAMKLSYFPEKQGNVFIMPTVSKEVRFEHHFPNYITLKDEMSKDLRAFVCFSRNVIVNGVRNSLLEGSLGRVKALVCSGELDIQKAFDEAEQNGKEIYGTITRNARIHAFFSYDRGRW